MTRVRNIVVGYALILWFGCAVYFVWDAYDRQERRAKNAATHAASQADRDEMRRRIEALEQKN